MKAVFGPLGVAIILVGILLEYVSYVLHSTQSKSNNVSPADLSKKRSGSDVINQPLFNGEFTNRSDIAASLH